MQLDPSRADLGAVELRPHAQRLAEPARPAAELDEQLAVAALAHLLEAGRWLERADQHGLPRALADPAARAMLPFTSLRFREPLLVDGIDVEGHVLWGMTLRLLDDVLPRLLAGEWKV